jgi:hypothetical protein
MKQTAVEWLIEQVKDYDFAPASDDDEYVIVIPKWILSAKRDEAKAMEREQVIDAYIECWMYDGGNGDHKLPEADEYYNKTYKGDE